MPSESGVPPKQPEEFDVLGKLALVKELYEIENGTGYLDNPRYKELVAMKGTSLQDFWFDCKDCPVIYLPEQGAGDDEAAHRSPRGGIAAALAG